MRIDVFLKANSPSTVGEMLEIRRFETDRQLKTIVERVKNSKRAD